MLAVVLLAAGLPRRSYCAEQRDAVDFLASLETRDSDPRAAFARLCDSLGHALHAPIHRRALLELFSQTYLNATLDEARAAQTALHTLAPGAALPAALRTRAALMDSLEAFFAHVPGQLVPAAAARRLVDRGVFRKFVQHEALRALAHGRARLSRALLADLGRAFRPAPFDAEL